MRWQVRAVLGTNTKLCRWTYLYALFVYEAHCHNTEQQKTTPRLHPPHHTPAPKIIYIIAMQQSLFCCWLPAPSVKVYWCSPAHHLFVLCFILLPFSFWLIFLFFLSHCCGWIIFSSDNQSILHSVSFSGASRCVCDWVFCFHVSEKMLIASFG